MAVSALLFAAALAVDAPIRTVTVFGDRARVTRVAEVEVAGAKKVDLPLLLDAVDPSSIRVNCDNGEVERIDVAHVDAEKLPRAETERLLDALDKLDALLARNQAEIEVWQEQINMLAQISPTLPPVDPAGGRPQPRLSSALWGPTGEFLAMRTATAQAKLRELQQKRRPLQAERDKTVADAQKLAARRRSGWRVTPTVAARGTVRLQISYVVAGATWQPSWEVQLQPEADRVEVRLSGLVRQWTGEDWNDAELTLSTAAPATIMRYPRILTWKIGGQTRFIPTPRREDRAAPPPPRAVPLLRGEGDRDEQLRDALVARVGMAPMGGSAGYGRGAGRLAGKAGGDQPYNDEDRDGIADKSEKPAEMPVAAPPPAPTATPTTVVDEKAPYHQVEAQQAIRYRRAPAARELSVDVVTESVGLSPPPGWPAVSYDQDHPASHAGGYDMSFVALARDSVRSDGSMRRLPLYGRTWPVQVERKVFPALADDSFLVAVLKSREAQPLPSGKATLFVGADPAGTATFPLMAPGESVTLPLGVDRALRPKRNVKVVQSEKGVINKDDISEYTVTIELANPYKRELALRVFDQLPKVPAGSTKDTEVKLLRTEPSAAPDEKTGALEWQLKLAPSAKTKITFVYTIKRPRGWELHQ